jgi:hypothetical protein
MREVRFEPDAIEELEQAMRWSEDRRLGLGGELLDEIDGALGAAARAGRDVVASKAYPVSSP